MYLSLRQKTGCVPKIRNQKKMPTEIFLAVLGSGWRAHFDLTHPLGLASAWRRRRPVKVGAANGRGRAADWCGWHRQRVGGQPQRFGCWARGTGAVGAVIESHFENSPHFCRDSGWTNEQHGRPRLRSWSVMFRSYDRARSIEVTLSTFSTAECWNGP